MSIDQISLLLNDLNLQEEFVPSAPLQGSAAGVVAQAVVELMVEHVDDKDAYQ